MLLKKNQATDPGNEKSIRVRVPERGIRADILGPRIEEQVRLHSLGRDQAPARNHFAPPAVRIISGSAGGIPEPVFGVEKWAIRFETVRKHSTPVGRDPSLPFRDPERQQLLRAEVEARLRQ